jgi:hypothetical protein
VRSRCVLSSTTAKSEKNGSSGRDAKELSANDLTCSWKATIHKMLPSLTPTVAISSNLTGSPWSGRDTFTGDNNAGVTRPEARNSRLLHSLRYQSTDACIFALARLYSASAAGESRIRWERGMRTVDESGDSSNSLLFPLCLGLVA